METGRIGATTLLPSARATQKRRKPPRLLALLPSLIRMSFPAATTAAALLLLLLLLLLLQLPPLLLDPFEVGLIRPHQSIPPVEVAAIIGIGVRVGVVEGVSTQLAAQFAIRKTPRRERKGNNESTVSLSWSVDRKMQGRMQR